MPPDPRPASSGREHHPSSETRFQELFEQASTSIQILAPDGRTLRVNQAWEDLWEIRAGTPLYAFIVSADYCLLTDAQLIATGIVDYLQGALDGESVEIPAMYYDVVVLGGSERARWVTARAHPIKDASGQTLEVMLMHDDITERVVTEKALREREQRHSALLAGSASAWRWSRMSSPCTGARSARTARGRARAAVLRCRCTQSRQGRSPGRPGPRRRAPKSRIIAGCPRLPRHPVPALAAAPRSPLAAARTWPAPPCRPAPKP